MTIKKFPTEDLAEIIYGGNVDDYTFISDDMTFKSRWHIHHSLVFGHGGKFWQVNYQVGATENCEESAFENDGDEIACTEVEPVEKTIVVYRPVAD